MVDSFARAVAEAEELAFIAGTGHDNQQPEGFTVDTILAAATVTTAAAGAVTIEEWLYGLGLTALSLFIISERNTICLTKRASFLEQSRYYFFRVI